MHDGLHIAAAARNENDDIFHGAHCTALPRRDKKAG
jgi:hypothetical protein